MDSQLFALVLVIALLVGCVYWIWRLNRPVSAAPQRKPSARKVENLDTLASWMPEPSRILTSHERVAFQTLRQAVPECMLLAQVPLARFLRVPTRNSYTEWLRRVGQLCADIVICDESSLALCVVEVRAPLGKESERGLRRHERMDRVLKAAGIPVIVWREGAIPGVEAARNAVLGEQTQLATREGSAHVNTDSGLTRLEPQVPPVPKAPLTEPLAQPAAEPAMAAMAGDHASAPELSVEAVAVLEEEVDFIQRREPPPSTWFDDLDSAPLPLDQKA